MNFLNSFLIVNQYVVWFEYCQPSCWEGSLKMIEKSYFFIVTI